MVVATLLMLVLGTILLASIVPLLQFMLSKKKASLKEEESFYFSQELFDHEMSHSDKIHKVQDQNNVNRFSLANRGWIRYPNGNIMNEADFLEKKNAEYSIELP